MKHFATYPLSRPHGEIFDYRSPLTNIVARVVEIVNGMSFQDVLSRDIWTAFGMEHPATISVDHLGFPIAEAGMSCTVRDLARFALAYLNDGMLNDRQVLSESWVRDTRETDDDARQCYVKALDATPTANDGGPDWYAYHNAFWIKERDTEFTGWGIFGQFVWVHRPSRTVIARFSTYPEAAGISAAIAFIVARLPSTPRRIFTIALCREFSVVAVLYTIWRLAMVLPLDQPVRRRS